jgi:hypothetical protein
LRRNCVSILSLKGKNKWGFEMMCVVILGWRIHWTKGQVILRLIAHIKILASIQFVFHMINNNNIDP